MPVNSAFKMIIIAGAVMPLRWGMTLRRHRARKGGWGGVKCVSADSAAPVWRSSVTPESEFKPPLLPKLSGFLLRRAAPRQEGGAGF